ncbi:hypothetical protein WQ54_23185 [Bacillus sp. SA1-12]|uniref:GDYXXLXY domain-containing protein n=1 Tax=Bacillus sp. SA1-12 TaxID=1455638 RepID=UPI000627047D|nr:GDYXXLXY domain-containing protein [Bacillus sp. SA1-12]KKI90030.1 hypothetical protein WQ54_23185 [Bacillus sp. SA1-12]
MNRKAKQLILACLVPIIILIGMTITPLITLMTGDDLTLRTKPIDPTDLFRGDYVNLSYEAEEVPRELIEKEVLDEYNKGSYNFDVFVMLEEKNGIHSPTKVSLIKPSDGIYLKGKLNYIGLGFSENDEQEYAYIQYSLDKYFVTENTGLEWEEASSKGQILAKVKVRNGYALLTDIIME